MSATRGLPGADRGGALEGVVVLEIAESLAAELAGGLLADHGAVVIKLEPPDGAPLRKLGPAIAGEDSLYFQSENRGKYSVQASLEDLAREPWLRRLVDSADALVEDLGPGRLEAAGLAPDALSARNPRLAILRISPFGQTGPRAGERGDDRVAQAYSGMQFATGFPDRPPIPVTVPLADSWTALLGTSALLMAIHHARRSGQGQVIDLGRYEAAVRMQEEVVIRYHRNATVTTRMGTESPTVVPANVYRTRDGGWLAVSGAGDGPFARLCEAIEAPDAPKDPRFTTGAIRVQHRAAADALVASWIAAHDLVEAEARFIAAGAVGTAVRSVDEIVSNAHVKARESLLALRSPSGREFLAPAAVPKLSRTPARAATAAPRLGEHTDAVRSAVEALAARPRVTAEPGAAEPGRSGPLSGIRLIDLSQWLAGPAAAGILADFGADVIMIELPGDEPTGGQGRSSPGFIVTNRNKRSVTLDVRSPRGREVFLDLVRASDAIIENFRPGTLERWKLGPAELRDANPRLVLLRASGFGQTGPDSARSAFNPVGLAFGGMTYLGGWPDRPPLRDGVLGGDYSTALFNAMGVMLALLRRDVDGEGQVVDTAMYEAVLRMTGDLVAVKTALGLRRERAGGDWPLHPVGLTLTAADGRFVAASAASWDEHAAALARLGRGGAATAAATREAMAALVASLPADQAAETLRHAGLAATVVNSVVELMSEAHLWSRGDLVRLPDPAGGEVVTQGVVPLLSRTPGRVAGWSVRSGSDNEAVLGSLLGLSPDEIARVTAKV